MKIEDSSLTWTKLARALVVSFSCANLLPFPTAVHAQPVSPGKSSTYLGSRACAQCHPQEYEKWTSSDHYHSMRRTNEKSVNGKFDGLKISRGKRGIAFSKHEKDFFVIDQGEKQKVSYTFGRSPLQQYLIDFPNGRKQAFDVAWDTRNSKEGQKWLFLSDQESDHPHDALHWTGRLSNWNRMCADCHSTYLRKNYDSKTDSYDTVWEEDNIGCEACHGAGTAHLQEIGSDNTKSKTEPHFVPFGSSTAWRFDPSTSQTIAQPTSRAVALKERNVELNVCAKCHSHRSPLVDGSEATDRFFDAYIPSLITSELYFPDGQIKEEVYVYGSFLQSKMHEAGVRCTNCHDAHSMKEKSQGNALCAQCHEPTNYDTALHHHHNPKGNGGSCVECHMPVRTYMQVDDRRDHSLRIPRPDVSLILDTPDACGQCHRETSAADLATAFRKWYPNLDSSGHIAVIGENIKKILHDLQREGNSAKGTPPLKELDPAIAIIGDSTLPEMVRASSLYSLGALTPSTLIDQITLRSCEPLPDAPEVLMRLACARLLFRLSRPPSVSTVNTLLQDKHRAVRVETMRSLLQSRLPELANVNRVALESATREYREYLITNADQAAGRVALGTFHALQGEFAQAKEHYQAAIRFDPKVLLGYTNLAEIHKREGDNVAAKSVLEQGRRELPQSLELVYALGLAYIRLKEYKSALPLLKRAAQGKPEDARFQHTYAVALHSLGYVKESVSVISEALKLHSNDEKLLELQVRLRDEANRK